MTQLLQQLTDPTVAATIGGALVAWILKRATALAAAVLVAGAGAWIATAAGKPLDIGAIAFNVLSCATGGTLWHQLFLRSPESKTPCAPSEVKVG